MSKQQKRPSYSLELRERAVRMVGEQARDYPSQWAAIVSIAGKFGCSAQTLHNWVAQAERDRGERAGLTSDERERMKALEREVKELRQANEILRRASAYFAMKERAKKTLGADTNPDRFHRRESR